ncbi:MAG: alpha/beta hydrolase [Patescibacteria group bacterium]|nr:alpha/beta hydrolase [Patescibacteria group bacterium]
MQEVVLIHGWLSGPRHHWFPWLKKELASRGYKVLTPVMPNPVHPEKDEWVAKLKQSLKGKDPKKTILIGHSLGTPTILYTLKDHKGPSFSRVVLVSGFARSIPHLKLVSKGFDMHFDMDEIKSKADQWTVIHGDNDSIVPFREGEWLANRLGVDLIIEKDGGHLIQYKGVFKLESVLKAIAADDPLSAELKENIKPLEGKFLKLESALREVLKLKAK